MHAPALLLIVATAAALLVLPDSPHRHLGDPSYWGVVGYIVVFVLLLHRRHASWRIGSANRRTVRLFLIGLPLVYVANWMRFGESGGELAVQLAGLVTWLALALGAGRSDLVLWLGVALHAVWDAAHLGRAAVVPAWYATACIAVDLGVGAFVLLCLREERQRG